MRIILVFLFLSFQAYAFEANCPAVYEPVCGQPEMALCEKNDMACTQVLPSPKVYGNHCYLNNDGAKEVDMSFCEDDPPFMDLGVKEKCPPKVDPDCNGKSAIPQDNEASCGFAGEIMKVFTSAKAESMSLRASFDSIECPGNGIPLEIAKRAARQTKCKSGKCGKEGLSKLFKYLSVNGKISLPSNPGYLIEQLKRNVLRINRRPHRRYEKIYIGCDLVSSPIVHIKPTNGAEVIGSGPYKEYSKWLMRKGKEDRIKLMKKGFIPLMGTDPFYSYIVARETGAFRNYYRNGKRRVSADDLRRNFSMPGIDSSKANEFLNYINNLDGRTLKRLAKVNGYDIDLSVRPRVAKKPKWLKDGWLETHLNPDFLLKIIASRDGNFKLRRVSNSRQDYPGLIKEVKRYYRRK